MKLVVRIFSFFLLFFAIVTITLVFKKKSISSTPLKEKLSLEQVRAQAISEVESLLRDKNIKEIDLLIKLKEKHFLEEEQRGNWRDCFKVDIDKVISLKESILYIINSLPIPPSPSPTPQPPPGPEPSPDDPPSRRFSINKTTGSHRGSTKWNGEDWEGENLLKPTGEEPEYINYPALPISSAGTEFWDGVISANFLPNGSALMMESDGVLKKSGIEKIIHAANGSPTKIGWSETSMTVKSTSRTIQNAIILAERNNYNKIAVPYLGGNFWVHGDDVYNTAWVIVNAALNQIEKLSEVVFVVSGRKRGDVTTHWDEKDSYYKPRSPLEIFQKMLAKYENKHPEKIGKGRVVKGDITDFSCHQCPVILNHLNMEGKLNGKISRAIVAKSGKPQKEMENDIKQQAEKFNKLFSNS